MRSKSIASSLEDGWKSSWTYNPDAASIPVLAEKFTVALKEIIRHCQSAEAGGRTPSDFPLARLDQAALDKLIAGRRDVEDVYPLSPIQTLFYSAHPGAVLSEFDQWQCTLRGRLDVSAFKRAWRETLNRHTVLRSTIHGEGLREPMQIVLRDVEPSWTIEDWSGSSSAHQAELWRSYLKQRSCLSP